MPFSPTHNLLVVSDLHLGADLKRTGFAWLRGVATLDREFGRFIDWYLAHPEGGKPWRLIVNGDMVDFINVTMLPGPEDSPGFEVRPDEVRFGLDGSEDKVAWMLGRVVDRHLPLFEKLAAFVAAGHDLAVLRGNHDVEFHWPLVQERFRTLLADVSGLEGEARGAFIARITFLPWFYYEPGAIFVEHGHQYDDYSSFEYVLAPVTPGEAGKIDLPLSHFAIRYLANAFPNISTHDKDGWGFMDYIRMGWSGKSGSFLGLFLAYAFTCVRLLRAVVRRKLGRAGREAHAEARRIIAEKWGLTVEHLSRLERLHRGGSLRSAFRAAQCFFVDRFLLFGGSLFMLLVITDRSLIAVGTFVMGTFLINRLLSGMRKAEVTPKLRVAGRAVALLMNVPLVVMGHSHKAVQVIDTPSQEKVERRYINTGTWIPPRPDAPGFTHLMVSRSETSSHAELRQWDAPESRPRAF